MDLQSHDSVRAPVTRTRTRSAEAARNLFCIAGLFAASGLSALMLEIVWFEMLQRVIGGTAQSMSLLLGCYMGGLYLGSLLLPRYVSTARHPLRVYGLLECGVAALALISIVALPRISDWYYSAADLLGAGPIKAGLAIAVLMPATTLMGATLPAVARLVESNQTGWSRIGSYYAANLLGAVAGTVLAGVVLLPLVGLLATSVVAAAISGTAGIAALLLARGVPFQFAPPKCLQRSSPDVRYRWLPIIVALSGAAALGSQIVWTRLLTMLYGASVYAFTIVLAVFLLGSSGGSALGAAAVRRGVSGMRLIACGQLLVAGLIPFNSLLINELLPQWTSEYGNPLVMRYGIDALRTAIVVGPPTLVWGATMSLAFGSVGSMSEAGRATGSLYAANTLGAVVGALLIGLICIPLDLRFASQVIVAGSVAAALLAWVRALPFDRPRSATARVSAAIASVGAVLVYLMPSVDSRLIAYGHSTEQWSNSHRIAFAADGAFASVAVSEDPDNRHRSFHVGGKVVASTLPRDMRLQLMLGAIPALAHPNPKSVLVIGAGAGVTAGTFVDMPNIERIVICEIEPAVVTAARDHFRQQNRGVFDDPRTEIVYDDARHFLASTDERFDIIASDPLHPWVKGAASLYTVEAFELARSRLGPSGVLALWIPLYQTSEAAVKSQIATADTAFESVSLWRSDPTGIGYDLVMLASMHSIALSSEVARQRLSSNGHLAARLRAAGIASPADLLVARIGATDELSPWLADARINRDRHLHLQYLAAQAFDQYDAHLILESIRNHL